MIVSLSFCLLLGSIDQDCLKFEPATVTISGKIVRQTFPGPPNYESVKEGDEPETYWLLILPRQVCVEAESKDEFNRSVKEVEKIQLVLYPKQYRQYKRLVGKNVAVKGKLFSSHTGHHHTEVLLTVEEIRTAR